MSDVNGNGPRRLVDSARSLAREPMAVVVLVLAFYLAQDAGWIPSMGRKAVDLISAHAANVDAIVRQRTATDAAFLRALQENARVNQALCLALAREPGIQRACVSER